MNLWLPQGHAAWKSKRRTDKREQVKQVINPISSFALEGVGSVASVVSRHRQFSLFSVLCSVLLFFVYIIFHFVSGRVCVCVCVVSWCVHMISPRTSRQTPGARRHANSGPNTHTHELALRIRTRGAILCSITSTTTATATWATLCGVARGRPKTEKKMNQRRRTSSPISPTDTRQPREAVVVMTTPK